MSQKLDVPPCNPSPAQDCHSTERKASALWRGSAGRMRSFSIETIGGCVVLRNSIKKFWDNQPLRIVGWEVSGRSPKVPSGRYFCPAYGCCEAAVGKRADKLGAPGLLLIIQDTAAMSVHTARLSSFETLSLVMGTLSGAPLSMPSKGCIPKKKFGWLVREATGNHLIVIEATVSLPAVLRSWSTLEQKKALASWPDAHRRNHIPRRQNCHTPPQRPSYSGSEQHEHVLVRLVS